MVPDASPRETVYGLEHAIATYKQGPALRLDPVSTSQPSYATSRTAQLRRSLSMYFFAGDALLPGFLAGSLSYLGMQEQGAFAGIMGGLVALAVTASQFYNHKDKILSPRRERTMRISDECRQQFIYDGSNDGKVVQFPTDTHRAA